MVEKKHIENFLKLNGLSVEDSEESIRGALESARWSPSDIEETFKILDGHASGEKMEMIVSRQLFTSDEHVDPKTLANLLGISVPGNRPNLDKEVQKAKLKLSFILIYMLFLCIILGGAAFFFFGLLDMFAVTAP